MIKLQLTSIPEAGLGPSRPVEKRARSVAPEAPSLWRRLFATDAHWAPTIARVALGAVILPHGAQKLFGWFGGYGFTGTMHWFTETMHIPWIFGFAAVMAESIGAVALLAGFASRLAAASLGVVMVVAVVTVHAPHGFFMNWFGNQKGEGVEFFIVGFALAAIVALHGGGKLSVDHQIGGSATK